MRRSCKFFISLICLFAYSICFASGSQINWQVNVQKVVLGSVSGIMDAFYIIINVVDIETGKIEFSNDAKANTLDEIISVSKNISASIVENYR
ncbi:MAG: hypothetical protein AB1633_08000 [Elusimicrobiota bacterium]